MLFLSLSLLSCQSKRGEQFENYVEKDMELALQKENDLYIIWDMKSCGTCLDKTKKILSEVAAKGEKNIHVIIVSPSKKVVNIFLGHNLVKILNVTYDLNHRLLDTDFFDYNNFYVYKYRDGKLVDDFYYNYAKNLDRFEKKVKRFKNFD